MKNPSKGKKVLIVITAIAITAILIGLATFSALYFSVKLDADAVAVEKATLKIVASDGTEIAPDALNRYVKYEDISTNIINAFVALEDKRFFKHGGIDYYRLAGAAVNNIKNGYLKEGGSTITQQLAKNTQLSNEKTFSRKIKEMKLAKDIEKEFSKEEILEMYLNAIYYGNGIYGIDSACKTYFDKSPAEVNIAESAILAGIVKNPSAYSPLKNKEKATERMKLVCKLMAEQGYISEAEYENALTYEYKQPIGAENFSYFSMALAEACKILNIDEKTLIKSGYTVKCYYDADIQKTINKLSVLPEFSVKTVKGKDALSSIMICDNESGGIISAYSSDTVNPATFRRSPGSCIKPIVVYAPALEKQTITEADEYIDEKTNFDGYTPTNYKDIYIGKTDIETAVKNSINTIAVKVFLETGKEYCIGKAIDAGINVDKNDFNPSFALGGMTYGTTARELCEAYMCFANGGMRTSIGAVAAIYDKNNKPIYRKSESRKKVFSEETSALITDLLQKTAKSGTAKKLSCVDCDIAAKTGTVSGGLHNTDAWCVSYSPDFTVCVWYGGADYSDSENIDTTGGGMPALLSANVYKRLPMTNRRFVIPDGIIEADIDMYAKEKSGKLYLASPNTPIEYRKSYLFDEKNAPDEASPYFDLSISNFSVNCAENGKTVLKFNTQYPYCYKVKRIDLKHNTEKYIYEAATYKNKIFDSVEFFDDDIEKQAFYGYILEVYCEGYFVGSQSATVLGSAIYTKSLPLPLLRR